jgi:hypothetical protein
MRLHDRFSLGLAIVRAEVVYVDAVRVKG